MSRYGATPLHLLAHLALLSLAGWALLQVIELRNAAHVLLWMGGAIVAHDLLLLPAYSVLDRLGGVALRGPAVNYVRVPLGLSALLGLVFLGEITGKGDPAFHHVSGLRFGDALGRWLIACAALFAASGAIYLLRARSGPRS